MSDDEFEAGGGHLDDSDLSLPKGRPYPRRSFASLGLPSLTRRCRLNRTNYAYGPSATIEKLIKEMLPANTTCAKDTRDMLGECCKGEPWNTWRTRFIVSQGVELNETLFWTSLRPFLVFLNLLTQAANEICDKEQKKTITGEHIMSALEQIGFADYVPELQAESADHQKTMKVGFGVLQERWGLSKMDLHLIFNRLCRSHYPAGFSSTLPTGEPGQVVIKEAEQVWSISRGALETATRVV